MNNENIKLKNREVLSHQKYKLEKVSFDFKKSDGNWEEQVIDAFDRENASAVLLYNKQTKKVILTRGLFENCNGRNPRCKNHHVIAIRQNQSNHIRFYHETY